MKTSLLSKPNFTLLILFFVLKNINGQNIKMYATSYGYSKTESGGTLFNAYVKDPENAILRNNKSAEIGIDGINGYPIHAELQLKFIDEKDKTRHLPAGTDIYIKCSATEIRPNIAANLTYSYKNAIRSIRSISGEATKAPYKTTIINRDLYIIITPTESFNAISIRLKDGYKHQLLFLFKPQKIMIYHAYYEYKCPIINISTPEPICAGENITLTIADKSTDTNYSWHDVAKGKKYLHKGTSYNTGSLTATKTFYVQSSSFSSECNRTPVTVTVMDAIGNPNLTIDNVSD